ERWLPDGHEILVIDNFATGKREVVPELPRLKVTEGTIADASLVDRCFDEFGPEIVIHSAAAYKDPSDWAEDIATNVTGTINVAKASKRAKITRLVNFQTALCYGRPGRVPIPVDHPEHPFTSYGISKTAGERYLLSSGLPVTSLRLANICGPRLAIGPIPTFYKRLKAGQNCFCSDTVRDFLDMGDFFTFMDRVIKSDATTGVFNVSTGEGHSIHKVFQAVATFLGMEPPEVPIVPPGADDVPEVVLDPSKAEKAFDWRAQVGFFDTIANQLHWYDQHGVSDTYSHLSAIK
ncbi:MAG: NAD-dependent epimerase/dehydratase family protein, partial [Dehalococcoidia bacterium]|nr:NAD-dependent epimerase/dehydratase family protein [Dehalococcoidia bacterium]